MEKLGLKLLLGEHTHTSVETGQQRKHVTEVQVGAPWGQKCTEEMWRRLLASAGHADS